MTATTSNRSIPAPRSHLRFLALVLVALAFGALSPRSASAQPAYVGAVVWAQWTPNSWYHGRVDRTCPGGLHVQFDDGDRACRSFSLIAVDQGARLVRPNARVLAPWRNGRMYPGRVAARLPNGLYQIRFDDGAMTSVPLRSLRTIGH